MNFKVNIVLIKFILRLTKLNKSYKYENNLQFFLSEFQIFILDSARSQVFSDAF